MPTIQTTDKSIIPFKVQELVGIISNKKRMSDTDAMMNLYNSQLYEEMADPAKNYGITAASNFTGCLKKRNPQTDGLRVMKTNVSF